MGVQCRETIPLVPGDTNGWDERKQEVVDGQVVEPFVHASAVLLPGSQLASWLGAYLTGAGASRVLGAVQRDVGVVRGIAVVPDRRSRPSASVVPLVVLQVPLRLVRCRLIP